MPSTDIDGSPIIVFSMKEAEVIYTALAFAQDSHPSPPGTFEPYLAKAEEFLDYTKWANFLGDNNNA